MVGTFKANNPLNTFLLFIYGLLLKFSFFSHLPVPAAGKTDGILYKELLLGLQSISNYPSIIYSIIAYLLLFTQAISFNKVLNDQRLLQRPTYLPAMSYLLVTSIFPEWNILSSALIVNTLLIWVWFKISGLNNSLNPKTTLFNVSIVIGITSFIYFPSLGFALLIVFSLMLTRPFNITEWAIALAGIIAPFYYLFAWLFLSDKFKFYKSPVFVIGYPRLQNYWMLGGIILILITFLTGAWFVQANFRKHVLQIRKSWGLVLFYLVIAVLIAFINDTHSFQPWIIIAIPLSAFISSAFFYPSKKLFPYLLHWLIVGSVIIISYYNK
ncbi:MAG: hypothetical protein ABIN97_16535 [Ginsengibacter sp.]